MKRRKILRERKAGNKKAIGERETGREERELNVNMKRKHRREKIRRNRRNERKTEI